MSKQKMPNFQEMAALGYSAPGVRDWFDANRVHQLAADAKTVTAPNTLVPIEYTMFLDPHVVEILSGVQNARSIFGEVVKGDWTAPAMMFRVDETVGRTQPYHDFADNGVADVNSNWPVRAQYVFETTMQIGDREAAMSGAAKLNLAAAKQRAVANVLNVDSNKFALLGVAGKEIYGILNDPNLNPATAAAQTWAASTTTQVVQSITDMFNEIELNSGSQITEASPMKLLIPSGYMGELLKATDFNVSGMDILKKNFPNLEVIALPELRNATTGNTAMLVATEVAGQKTGEIGYSIKLMGFPMVRELSAYSQKWASSTYGGIVYLPFAIASRTGI